MRVMEQVFTIDAGGRTQLTYAGGLTLAGTALPSVLTGKIYGTFFWMSPEVSFSLFNQAAGVNTFQKGVDWNFVARAITVLFSISVASPNRSPLSVSVSINGGEIVAISGIVEPGYHWLRMVMICDGGEPEITRVDVSSAGGPFELTDFTVTLASRMVLGE